MSTDAGIIFENGEFRSETDEEITDRRADLRQEVADFLGNLGYELDSDDETYELLMWAFVDDPEPQVVEQPDYANGSRIDRTPHDRFGDGVEG